MTSAASPAPDASRSAWAPLRITAFRALWLAQLGSMVGTWMQTVGAQWLLLDEPNATTLVALVQTMSMLPVLLLALPSGVIADSFDRRRWLVLVQSCSFVVAATLAVLTAVDQPSPALLLTFTFLLGCGAALATPAWLAIIPDLVPRDELPAAAALGSISINVARAVGPAAAGVLISLAGVPLVFAFNAVSYAVPAVALLVWGPAPAVSGDIPERFVPALRAGARYIRHSLITRRILLRSILFVAPGASLWALLPLVATERLGLDAAGFGFLLGAVGVGAVGGAFVMPRLRSRVSVGQLIGAASLVYALALLTLALVTNVPLVVAVLLLAGAAWLAVLASLGAAMQMFLPVWVRARGLSAHTVVFVGGQAVGAVVWGVLGQYAGLAVALVAAAAVTAVGAATLAVWPLIDASHLDRGTVSYWSEPNLAFEPDPDEGPVLISLTYSVTPEQADGFLAAMEHVRRSRQRTGAIRWGLYQDGEDPRRFVEVYLVPSWQEHLRQHSDRLTGADQEIEAAAVALADGPPEVAHLFRANRAR
jgi:MFS family permease/quinol monooxygenase YgiN